MNRAKFSILLILLSLLFMKPVMVNAEQKVYRGSADRQDITDVLQDYADGEYTNINDEQMKKGTSYVNNTVGTLTSIVIIFLYAALVVVTGIDLAYIGIPAIRNSLYQPASGNAPNGQTQNQTQNTASKKPLITTELKALVDAKLPQNVLLKEYIKKRAMILVLIVIITILFIQSTVFLKMGMNVGGALLEIIQSFTGA